jgi:hypothetical protein
MRFLAVSALSGQCPNRTGRLPGPTMPSADSCRTVRTPCDALSHDAVTCGRPPEVSLAAFDARPPDLPPRHLMDADFAASCPLVLSRRPRIRFLSIRPHLRYGFFQTTPRGVALASRLPFASIRLGRGLTPPSNQACSAHKKRGPKVYLRASHKRRHSPTLPLTQYHRPLRLNFCVRNGNRCGPQRKYTAKA